MLSDSVKTAATVSPTETEPQWRTNHGWERGCPIGSDLGATLCSPLGFDMSHFLT